MNKYMASFSLIVFLWMFGGCVKLEVLPKDQLIEESIFGSYDGFKTYAWQFYEVFTGYNNTSKLDRDVHSDLFLEANPNAESTWIWQRRVVPTASDDYTKPYERIREVNMLIANVDNGILSEAEASHWRSVGYFFRACNYAELLNRYGGVPYIDRVLTDADTEALMAPRNTRDEVAQHILEDLQFAEANINPEGDGANTVNVHVVRAQISRFGLMEGTWRKYHGLANAETYLEASLAASARLATDFPVLNSNYDLDFNSESLAGVPGILLYKQYVLNQITHNLSTRNRNSSGRHDLTKKAVDLFLMTDGKTRFTSDLFEGDKSPYDEFRNRDRRLYYVVPPPYFVNTNAPSLDFTYTDNPQDTSYFGLMTSISDGQHKALPSRNWNRFVVRGEPHYVDYNLGQPYNVTYTGYRFYKYYNQQVTDAQGQDISDAPIFRMGEVLANYAEAAYELGRFDQNIADITMNKLRERGGVLALDVMDIPDDPTRDPTVTPLLWEIRRERAVELIGEGFRLDDLRRWKKLDYTVARKLGRWLRKGVDVPVSATIPILDGATEGYIAYEGVPPTPYLDYYYLDPIPSNQLVLNPNIEQNEGWE
ncbi:RagB/SusD family nutrient uptake outer membrane protein [Parapedobacter indicus]|uniref:Starch-binding associating with outer membrane n=1 Tax=Parapedobacter indicus TaxID=1477437 RepID=A0A1I3F333_9SPHI|nr:RagB/SusD family nutrient uptake outer membrane protein [Parapedobacter indicus]PPL03539.1 putative outer membrane starch-binding protein [Parapedobacter indicus]SFI05573.1 Starch-binding associating with outer membrane [Parapedobacter indicus]